MLDVLDAADDTMPCLHIVITQAVVELTVPKLPYMMLDVSTMSRLAQPLVSSALTLDAALTHALLACSALLSGESAQPCLNHR